MKVERIVVGNLEENCYIVEKAGKVLVIDPGADFKKIQQALLDKKVVKVLITHQHFDHIGALCDIMDIYKVGKLDFQNLEEREYQIGPFTFQVIFTPGHSADSVSFYFPKEKIMFVGDFVFQRSIGRWDLPSGNYQDLKKSIQKLLTYPEDIVLYPGHGPTTVLKEEKENNPYF